FRLPNGEINLIDPTGTPRGAAIVGFPPTTGDLSFLSLCGAPNIHCSNPPAPAQSFGFGYTLDITGEWKLMLGGDFTVGGTYTMSIHTGGGGDDCVQGRAPTLTVPPPVDAPNQGLSIRLLDVTETNCSGSLPFPDLDFHDLYAFPVVLGEQVVVSVASTDGLPPCSGAIGGAIQGPFGRVGGGAFGCTGDFLLRSLASANAGISLTPAWSATTDLRNYRLRVATSAHHNGDCFTGAAPGNALTTATPMPISACVGDISATDPEDWYSFGAAVGQHIDVLSFPSGGFFDAAANFVSQPVLPVELYGPDGLRRGSTSALADQSGSWHVRVATRLPRLPQYLGSYGIPVPRTAPFASLTVSPGTVVGGNPAQGTINLGTTTTDPVFFSSINAVPSNVAVIPQSFGSLTVPPGSSSATFPINTFPVTASASVTISASTTDFSGNTVTNMAILTVAPPPAPPVPADTVTITLAQYNVAKQILSVQATSTSTTATLQAFVTATGALIGTLSNAGGGKYQAQFSWPTNPSNITVKSRLGGSATMAVTAK